MKLKIIIAAALVLSFSLCVFSQSNDDSFIPENTSFERAVFDNNLKEAVYFLEKEKPAQRQKLVNSNKYIFEAAVTYGNLEMVKVLVQNGVNLKPTSFSPLAKALIETEYEFRFGKSIDDVVKIVSAKNEELARYLISTGKMNQQSFEKAFIEIAAASKDPVEDFQFLMSFSKIDDKTINTAFKTPNKTKPVETAKFLMANGKIYKESLNIAFLKATFLPELSEAMDFTDLFLEQGYDINSARASDGANILMIAAFNNKFDFLKFLIERGADIKTTDKSGKNVLSYSARHYDLTRYLIEKGADVRNVDNLGVSLIFDATMYGNIEVVKFYIALGQDPNMESNNKTTPLMLAAIIENFDMIKFLISQGAFVDVSNAGNSSPIYLAKKKEIRAYLEEQKKIQSKMQKQKIDNTPLMQAVVGGNISEVEQLVELGADINERVNIYKMTGLSESALMLSAKNYDIAKYLIEKGAYVTAYDRKGENILFYAVRSSNIELIKYLLEKQKMDVNSRSFDNTTPLFYAAKSGNLAIVKLLIESGADVFAKNNKKQTPLKVTSSKEKELKKYIQSIENINKK